MSQDHWNNIWIEFEAVEVDPQEIIENSDPLRKSFLSLLGDVKEKQVLDLGCGNGLLSVYLAKKRAYITAIDNSAVAAGNTKKLAEYNAVSDRVQAFEWDALRIPELGKIFDLVTGQFILHHVEPFEFFAGSLRQALNSGGRGLFVENSALNALLMFFRKYLVGRFGIPKMSDDEEWPLEPAEIKCLKRTFSEVRVHYPQFACFSFVGPYLLKGNRWWGARFWELDQWIEKFLPFFRKYSYYQIVELLPETQ